MYTAFSFTEADLDTNRLGRLSERQRQQLGAHQQRQRWQFGLLWGMMLVLMLASLFAARHLWELALWWGLEVAFMVWLGWRSIPVFRPSGSDADLAAVEGTASLKVIGTERYGLWIGNLRFNLTLDQYHALTDGERYRVYYIIPQQQIVAVMAMAPLLIPHEIPPALGG